MKNVISLILVIAGTLLITGCGQVPLYRTSASMGKITWHVDVYGNRMVTGDSRAVYSNPLPTDPSMDKYSDYYATYGEFKKAYTPTSVRLPLALGEIIMVDSSKGFLGEVYIKYMTNQDKLDPKQFVMDFANPIIAKYTVVPNGSYDSFEVSFRAKHTVNFSPGYDEVINLFDTPAYHHIVACEITVDLGDEYAGVFGDIPSIALNVNNYPQDFIFEANMGDPVMPWEEYYITYVTPAEDTFFERRNESGGSYIFTLHELFPRNIEGYNWADEIGILYTRSHVFSSLISSVQIGSIPSLKNYGATGGTGLLIPINPVEITEKNNKITIVISLDTTNLIEVYEGPTTANSDDIIVIADKYWEHFAFDVIYE